MSRQHAERDLFDDDLANAASSRDGDVELLVSKAEMGSVKPTAVQDDDDLLYYELKNKTLMEDVIESFQNAKYVALFGMILVAFVGYQVTVGQYQSGHVDAMARPQHTWETLQFVRPVLDADKKKSVHDNTLYGETSLHMPNNDAISFGFQRAADKYGSFPLPELFYQGVFFSVGLGNAHDVPYSSVARKGAVVDGVEHVNTNGEDDVEGVEHVTDEERARLARELLVETGRSGQSHSRQQHNQHSSVHQRVSHGRAMLRRLHSLKPKPMYITPRVVTNNASQWVEEGYMVYYSYKQLDAAGMLSSKNPTQPWSRVSEKLLEVAREFRQMYVTVYYAHAFGPSSTNQMLQLAEKSRRQRALMEKSGDARYKKQVEEPRPPNPRTAPYRLHQSYEEAYGISAPPQSEVDLLDDEVSFYRNAYPNGPSTKSKGFRPRRSQRSLTASSVVHPTTADGKSVMQSVRDAFSSSEEEARRKLQGELRDEHGHKFETVIQMVLPTHTGLDEIKSSCAVWLSKFNHRRPSEQILKDFEEAAGATEAAARQSTSSRSLFNAPVKPSAASAKGFTFTADTADGGTKPAADAGKAEAEAEARELTPQESSVAFLHAAPRALFNPLGDAGTVAAKAEAEDEDEAKEQRDERELGGSTASRNRDSRPVQLPYFGPSSNAKEGSRRGLHETSAASTPSVDYFDFLLSYNHDAKLRVENVVYQREWHKSFRSPSSAESTADSETVSSATIELMGDEKPRTAAGASSSTSFSFSESADRDLHWSAYVPYATAKEYAKKYGINPDFLVDREVLNRQRM